ncbi:MAG: P-loop NTPase [Deltaproteobacteria bacterium]|nr:P-loop NTPase [Deltaproteobacteria bacterium]
MARTITVVSGPESVGKTTLCLNLARHLAGKGAKVCVVDADTGPSALPALLGITPGFDLRDTVLDGRNLQDIIVEDPAGVLILPGGCGVEEMPVLEASRMNRMIESFFDIVRYDYVLIDTHGGSLKHVFSFCQASPEIIVVMAPKPASLTAAVGFLKDLVEGGFEGEVRIVVNRSRSLGLAKVAFKKFKTSVEKYLRISVTPLGLIFEDDHVPEAARRREAFVSLFPESRAARCIRGIGERLIRNRPDHLESFDVFAFWKGCLELVNSPASGELKEGERPETLEPEAPAPEVDLEPSEPGAPLGHEEPPTVIMDTETEEPDIESPRSGGWFKKEEEGRVWKRAPLADAQVPEAHTPLDPALVPLMEKLVESISALSKELNLLRKAFNGNGRLTLRFELSAAPRVEATFEPMDSSREDPQGNPGEPE